MCFHRLLLGWFQPLHSELSHWRGGAAFLVCVVGKQSGRFWGVRVSHNEQLLLKCLKLRFTANLGDSEEWEERKRGAGCGFQGVIFPLRASVELI